jgi:hypothetical protein
MLLDTLSIMLNVIAEDAIEQTENLNQNLDQTEGSADRSTTSLDRNSKANAALSKQLKKTITSLGKAALGFVAFSSVVSQAADTDRLGKFANLIGQSVDEINAIGEATKREGGSIDAFGSSIKGLQDALTDVTLTGGGETASILARLGIVAVDATGKAKDAVSLLPEIARSFESISRADAVGLGQKLGLDQATIMLLQKGEQGFRSAVSSAKQLGVTTQEDAEAAAEFANAWADLDQIMVKTRTTINTLLLPVFTRLLKGYATITKFVSEHKNLVIGFFAAISVVIMRRYLPAVMRAVAATLTFLAPYLLIGAAIATVAFLIGALIEDFVAFYNGQESLIGRLAERWPWFGKIVNGILDGIKFAIKVVGDAFEWLMGLWDKLDFSSFDKLTSSIGDILGFGDSDDNDTNVTVERNRAINMLATNDAAANRIASQRTTNTINNQSRSNRTTIDKVEIKVNSPNSDPNAVASAVGEQLKKQMAMAQVSNASGVM